MKISDCFSPCSERFKTCVENFKQLEHKKYQVGIIILTVLATIFTLSLATCTVFCSLVGRFKRIEDKELPSTKKMERTAQEIFKSSEKTKSIEFPTKEIPVFHQEKQSPPSTKTGQKIDHSSVITSRRDNDLEDAFAQFQQEYLNEYQSKPMVPEDYLSEDDIYEIEEESSSEELKTYAAPIRKYVPVLRKEAKETTIQCINRITQEIEETLPNFELCYTIDDGNCFWDAFAQNLSMLKNSQYTVKDLRREVYEYVNKNPIFEEEYKRLKLPEDDPYSVWKERLLHDGSGKTIPSWGSAEIEGVILSRVFNVAVQKIEVDFYDNFTLWISNSHEDVPHNDKSQNTVRLAAYPKHFLAILPKGFNNSIS